MSLTPPKHERLAFWRDEYARASFMDARDALISLLRNKQSGQPIKLWLTLTVLVLYARPFKQRAAVRLSDTDVPEKYRGVHENVILHRDKLIAHRDPDSHEHGVYVFYLCHPLCHPAGNS